MAAIDTAMGRVAALPPSPAVLLKLKEHAKIVEEMKFKKLDPHEFKLAIIFVKAALKIGLID